MPLRNSIARRPVATFVVLALGLTWAIWVPRAAAARSLIDAPWLVDLGAVWTHGLLAAAAITAALVGGRAELRAWVARVIRWRVGWQWYAVALLGPAAFWLAYAGVAVLLGEPWTAVRPRATELAPLSAVAVLAALIVTDGLGEEAGWRGYALPRLLDHRKPLPASLILGVVWAVWHLPLLFTPGTTMYGSPFWFHLLDMPATAVLYTWLFLRGRGSALLAILLHASNNLWTAAAIPTGTTGQLAGALAAKWLLAVIAARHLTTALMARPE